MRSARNGKAAINISITFITLSNSSCCGTSSTSLLEQIALDLRVFHWKIKRGKNTMAIGMESASRRRARNEQKSMIKKKMKKQEQPHMKKQKKTQMKKQEQFQQK